MRAVAIAAAAATAAALVFAAAILASCGHASPPAPRASAAAPASNARAPQAPSFESKDVDAALRAEWTSAGIEPAPRVDDGRWIRRVFIDVVGTIPPPEKVSAFLADAAPDKRAKLVDALLASPAYAEHWKNYWDDELLGPGARAQDLDRAAFRRWLRARFAENAPWDRIVVALVSATGANGGGAKNTGAFGPDDGPEEPGANGAVNWLLRYEQAPQDLAGAASKTFLGVQIQCAQCHDHKTEAWKQRDFWSFATAFARTRAQPIDADKEMGKVRRVELVELDRVAPRFRKNADLADLFTAPPRALDGTALPAGTGTRRALAAWMTSKDNPYFARAFVNRMWGHFFGRGFSDPVNDMRASNPPTMDPLLAKMAQDFSAHGYDVKRLVRTIALTEAYQLAPAAPAKADPENKKWSRFRLTPMGPEELLNAIVQATGLEGAMREARMGNVDQLRAQLARSYAFLFDVDEDADAPSYDGTVSQALSLLNGTLVGTGSSAIPGGALDAIVSGGGAEAQKIEKLYMRALSRPPTNDELDAWTAYVRGATPPVPAAAPNAPNAPNAKDPGGRETARGPVLPARDPGGRETARGPVLPARDPGGRETARGPVLPARDPLRRLGRRAAQGSTDPTRAAYEDVFWTLLNSSEFLFNH